jgi:hypothetical protein
MFTLFAGENRPWQIAWDQLMSDIRYRVPLPPRLQGAADVYPQHTAVVFAQPELTYAPRPAYLSLNAHTKRLANANATHLKSENAPNILCFKCCPSDALALAEGAPDFVVMAQSGDASLTAA